VSLCLAAEDKDQPEKSKRSRTAFSAEQLIYLEEYFKKKPYLDRTPRAALSIALNLSERQIKIWFQNRRMRAKKERQNNKNDDRSMGETEIKQGFENSPQENVTDKGARYVVTNTLPTSVGINPVQTVIPNGDSFNLFNYNRNVVQTNVNDLSPDVNFVSNQYYDNTIQNRHCTSNNQSFANAYYNNSGERQTVSSQPTFTQCGPNNNSSAQHNVEQNILVAGYPRGGQYPYDQSAMKQSYIDGYGSNQYFSTRSSTGQEYYALSQLNPAPDNATGSSRSSAINNGVFWPQS